ncbi:MAG: hypothetical protein OEY29_14890 [Gammaproteobacteria bacterium]|nr:hypothetical protein [Gammaproteobacteria bacterium]
MGNIFTQTLVMAALLLLPLWKIYSRAGLNPYLSLTVLIPGFGFFIACIILAVSKWNLTQTQDEVS